ncbi:translesion error-prone DNA polymerase V autoproteolytic subunit [Microbacterium oxydans]|uniref:LexA family protein n=1 Tax=Microbacterium TaxID=33882 RepID=UPI00187D6A91|nr:translesion error-prone DNA polymerase V autoproteolytic subunit [Microbacterium sp. R1]MBE7956324.1 translesion error-prone DNA polymerase V autoproteolytic subunit [Microbacterium sp. R1]MCB8044101.1 translesion error-prone DNA polymerase V autoproteolytic subunit [Microbacterium oxydans]
MLATLPRQVDSETASTLLAAPVAVACGFPSPAQDYYDGPIDLTDMLVDDQAATFIVRAAGHSMTGAGISDGDELLVDRSKHAQHGDIIVAVLDGELTVKRLELTAAGVVLRAESAGHPDIVVPELSDFQVWGVATYCIHHLR